MWGRTVDLGTIGEVESEGLIKIVCWVGAVEREESSMTLLKSYK